MAQHYRRVVVSFVLLLCTNLVAHAAASSPMPTGKIMLKRNWRIQSSCQVSAQGADISAAGFATTGWHDAEVPTTVVAALVADKTYPDPFFGKNLESFPGMDYSKTTFFANQPMPEDSPFRCSWWFRTEFTTPAESAGKKTWLHFDAINYRASIWLNGKKIADAQDVAGTYRIYQFDVTPYLAAHGPNALAVEVTAPNEHDLGMTWVDWNPTPADKDMGLWKDVYLTNTGDIELRHPYVHPRVADDLKSADLTLSAEVINASDSPVKGTVRAAIENIHVSQSVDLNAGESKFVTFSPEQFPQLKIARPRLWWPHTMGTPEMYSATFSVESGGLSDQAQVHFGIRKVTSELTSTGGRLFSINGRKLLVRGAAWAPDMFLRWSPEQAAAAIDYTHAMGLNAIRFEGRMERDEFFDMADRKGILIMPGWTCCDMWEHWNEWTPDTMKIAAASLTDQIERIRNHPSVFVWLYGSDNPPPPNVENMYLKILSDLDWPNPSVSSASEQPTTVTGPSGVKMTGPYDYVPPNYWLTDTKAGGAYGYNTETSPGPVIPPLESLKKFIPADHLWPVDDYWNYHAGGDRFTTIDRFMNGLTNRYGKPDDLHDFLRKSQAMNYEAERAMFEAYARNKYVSTGVIQWMLNNAWPSLIWHLYDYYLVPAGGYFGTKKACEPLHVQYSYDDSSVAVINGYDHSVPGLRVSAKVYSMDGKLKSSAQASLDAAADSSSRALSLPAVGDIGPTYFLKLELKNAQGKVVSDNFYWLSTKPDVIAFDKKEDTLYTPQSDYADLTGLSQLKPVKVVVKESESRAAGQGAVRVMVSNPGSSVAFMVHLRVATSADEDVVPIFWDENYFSLLPGERREVTAHFDSAKLAGKTGLLIVDGWNVAPASQALMH